MRGRRRGLAVSASRASQELLHPARAGPRATTATARGDHVDAEAGLGMAGGMGAAVVRRKELDVLMKLSAIELVLDSVVGEMNLVVEVGQIMFARPVTDLVLFATRSA